MIKSMTGFGRGFAGRGQNKIEVEIRSVNSRFLELKFRGVPLEPKIEQQIRQLIGDSILRGNIQVYIEYNYKQDLNRTQFNKERFELIQQILKEIHVNYGQRLSLSHLISTNDLFLVREKKSLNENTVIKAFKIALGQLMEMRQKEGEIIQKDISDSMNKLNNFLGKTEELVGQYKNQKQKLLIENVSEFIDSENLDESRLIQEVAYYTERSDVNEEIVRCKSHFEQLNNYFRQNEPVGKRINFLLQEINREINTIGSKSPQSDVTTYIVEMKSELEKIREQSQNIL